MYLCWNIYFLLIFTFFEEEILVLFKVILSFSRRNIIDFSIKKTKLNIIRLNKISHNIFPWYSVHGYLIFCSSQCTRNLSAKYLTIFPDNDIVVTRHQLSIKISLVFVNLSLLSKKNKKKNGTQVPGPLDTKCVVFNKWFLINLTELINDFIVVNTAVR